MPRYVMFRIEVNVGRQRAEPAWHYLMEDDFTACQFEDEAEARNVLAEEGRGDNARLVGFNANGIGGPIS